MLSDSKLCRGLSANLGRSHHIAPSTDAGSFWLEHRFLCQGKWNKTTAVLAGRGGRKDISTAALWVCAGVVSSFTPQDDFKMHHRGTFMTAFNHDGTLN